MLGRKLFLILLALAVNTVLIFKVGLIYILLSCILFCCLSFLPLQIVLKLQMPSTLRHKNFMPLVLVLIYGVPTAERIF